VQTQFKLRAKSLAYKLPLLICVGLFLLQLALIWTYAVDIPYWDEWETFQAHHLPEGLTLKWLFEQQNEHRPLTTKLLVWFLYHLNGWNLIVHQILNFAIYGLILLWLVWFAKKISHLPVWIILSFIVFLLSPINYENHFWGYQSLVHFWLLFFLASSYYLFSEAQRWSELIAGSTLSILSIYSFGSGIVSSFVILVIFGLFKGIRAFSATDRGKRTLELRQLIIVVIIVGSALALWLNGYERPPYHPPLTFPDKWKFWDFFLNLISFGFGIDKVSVFLGIICLLIVLVPLCGILRQKRNPSSGQWMTFALVLSLLAVLASISASRAGFGARYAKSSRYAEFGMILIPLSLLSWSFFLNGKERLKKQLIAGIWFFCFLTFGNNWLWFGNYDAGVASFRSYQVVAAIKMAGVECVKTYYFQGGDGYCPTIYPNVAAPKLEEAKKLNASFYRRIAQQYQQDRSQSRKLASNGTTTIGVYRPSESIFYLRNSNASGESDVTIPFGLKGDVPVVGDWDGNSTTTIGVYRPSESTFYLRNNNASGEPDLTIPFGMKGDVPIAGDWDGDGTTTIGVYRPNESTFYLRNSNAAGEPDVTISFGLKGDMPVVGDWDGNGTTTIGVYRPSESTFYLRNSNVSGVPDLIAALGKEVDMPVAGDWDGNGTTTVGVYRPSESIFYLRNSNASGAPDLTVSFGTKTDMPVVGDWDGK
jgi:hypothetical protein